METKSDFIVPTPPYLLRLLRSHPHVWSVISKARLFFSRYILAAAERGQYKREKPLFSMSDFEKKHCDALTNQGFTIIHDFFPVEMIDRIYQEADRLFKDLRLDYFDSYSVQKGRRNSLEGLTYQDLEGSEKIISLKDPLINVPVCINLAFHESILKVVTNFLGYMPPRYKPMLVRDFPLDKPRESSNFHKDNDESDSVQVFVYLVDIDETRGPLVYVPGTNKYDVRSCRPRLNRDLGVNENDGRISDREMEKFYPKDSWAVVKARRGSVAIIHGNGFHKGPFWPLRGDAGNRPRTALRIDIHGYNLGSKYLGGRRIKKEDYESLTTFQRLFTKLYTIVE